MIDLYYFPTPNGHKITIALEELNLPYKLHRVDITQEEQFDPEFLAISPNNKIPAIVDHQPIAGDRPLNLFESGAILLYLAEKAGRLMPATTTEQWQVRQWLFWQIGGLGPMLGQNHHFCQYAPEEVPYAIDRYVNETNRLYRVLEHQLLNKDYIVGESFTVVDIACYPWIVPHEKQRQNLEDFPSIARWLSLVSKRGSVQRAYAIAE